MTSTSKSKRRVAVALAALSMAAMCRPSAARATEGPNDPLPLTSDLLQEGFKILKSSLVDLANANISLKFYAVAPLGPVGVDVNFLKRRKDEVEDRLKNEQNDLLRQQLQIMRDQLAADLARNDLLAAQANADLRLVEYTQQRDEGVLRQLKYTFAPDKLVVVVADFSCGAPDEGREVADEIAVQLAELKKHGIDIIILPGEIKPGVVIRSDEMASDVGRHFPPDTEFVVIWGTMSPQTVGCYRPHITCVQKVGDAHGVTKTFDINLDAGDLPQRSDKELYRRECYKRLIGTTCAAIPSCYAAYQINRERTPDLNTFYTFLGNDREETKTFQRDLEPLTRWTRIKTAVKGAGLRRITGITTNNPYPLTIVNEKDGSVMTLLRDKEDKPILSDAQELVYIDVLETNLSQYAEFLSAKGNHGSGKTPYYDEGGAAIPDLVENPPGVWQVGNKQYKRCAVANVCWSGTQDYCLWAGKTLPSVKEWQKAAESAEGKTYLWGDAFEADAHHCNSGYTGLTNASGGLHPDDRSRIGCFDMAGNVAEWCDNWYEEGDANNRAVCGGSFNDKNEVRFQVKWKHPVDQVDHKPWVGFRGVIRIPMGKATP